MVLTDFLKNLTTSNLAQLAAQARDNPQIITGQSVSPTVQESKSFQQAATIFQNILSGGQLPETFRQRVTTQNLIGLGEASIDISNALSEQVTIRENNLVRIQDQFQNQQIALGQVNQRLSQDVTELGQSITDLGKGQNFDPVKFFTENPLIGGIGIGGLLVGGIVLFLLIK